MRKTLAVAALATSALLFGACGGSGTKHVSVDFKVNGHTMPTTPKAQCQAHDSYSKGINAWNALPQAQRDAVEAQGGFYPEWAKAHGYATSDPTGGVTFGCD